MNMYCDAGWHLFVHIWGTLLLNAFVTIGMFHNTQRRSFHVRDTLRDVIGDRHCDVSDALAVLDKALVSNSMWFTTC